LAESFARLDYSRVSIAFDGADLERRRIVNSDFFWMRLLIPEGIVVLTALVVLGVDLILARKSPEADRGRMAGLLSCLGCLAAMTWLTLSPASGNPSMLALNPLTQLLKFVLLGLTVCTALISFRTRFTRHIGEYFALLLLASAGLMLLMSSDNLLMIFAALELPSLALYIMTAFNKESVASAEAALKYFLFGSMAAAFTLFGISLIYGITGEIQLGLISAKLAGAAPEPVFYVALVMTLAGFAFKIAAAPFHFWAPDAYNGAPAPIGSFIASGSKVASFFILGRIVLTGFGSNHGSAALGGYLPGWMPLLAVLAVVSMVAGNIAALVQTSVKRLLAYSAVAHAGYGLLALQAGDGRGLPALLFFVITYAVAVLGAFAVVSVLEENGQGDQLRDFAGLSRRSPLLSFCMLVFVLSLAGIPPLAGFFGKFYVFIAAAGGAPRLGLLWLVAIAVAASAVSLYYYLQVLKQIYAAKPDIHFRELRPSFPAYVAIVLLAVVVVALGCAPELLLNKISSAIQFSTF
jgi:NADH-quinone oxidoreductase subunit N